MRLQNVDLPSAWRLSALFAAATRRIAQPGREAPSSGSAGMTGHCCSAPLDSVIQPIARWPCRCVRPRRTWMPGARHGLTRSAPACVVGRSPTWDSMPTPANSMAPWCSRNRTFTIRAATKRRSRRSTFAPDPQLDSYCWDGQTELGVYGGKHLNRTQYPWIEGFTPLYGNGPWPPSFTFMGPTNLVRPKLYLYGDFRTAWRATTTPATRRTSGPTG